MGKSAIGAGRKAGSFNYATQFVNFKEVQKPQVKSNKCNELTKFISQCVETQSNKEDFEKLGGALQSYIENYENEFSQAKDYCKVRGEDNYFKYLPLEKIVIRVSNNDTLFEIVARILAARVAKVSFKVSINDNVMVKSFLESAPVLSYLK